MSYLDIQPLCKVDGCGKKNNGAGLCGMHRARIMRATRPVPSLSPEYTAWRNMIQRCTNMNHPYAYNYIGRGITVCDRWRNSYKLFIEDLGKRPGILYSLDRINNDGNYEPGNVKWSTKREQATNSRDSINKYGYPGISPSGNKWKVCMYFNGTVNYLGTFSMKKDAIKCRKMFEKKYP